MPRNEPPSDIEASGDAILSVVVGMGAFQTVARRLLRDAGLPEVRAGEWYPMHSWIQAFGALATNVGERTLFLVGTKIPETAMLPPNIVDVASALGAIDVGYHMNHRRSGAPMFDPATGTIRPGIGNYALTAAGAGWATLVCDNPYPCDFDCGIVHGFAARFAPDRLLVRVTHGDDGCRKTGAQSCSYRVRWV
jgi:hypothetical protein